MRIGAIILVLAAASAAPAAADPLSTTVVVTREDLATPQARAKLDRRIRGAIETVCGSYATAESYQWPEMDACWAAARTDASRKLAAVSRTARIEFGSR